MLRRMRAGNGRVGEATGACEDAIVVADALTKRYGETVAPARLDLSIAGGGVYGFLGRCARRRVGARPPRPDERIGLEARESRTDIARSRRCRAGAIGRRWSPEGGD
jgi:hypothetical protein